MQDSIEDYIRISRNIKEGPTQVSVSRKEALITAQIKKECDAKAMQILQFAIEGKMRSDALFRCLPYINQSHYQDIVEERAISKLCGYPLCSRHIPDMPKKQFYISTKSKKVYDLTDRKNYCSNFCYRASIHIKGQIDTSPLWLRKHNEKSHFTLLNKSEKGLPGEVVDIGVVRPPTEPFFTSVSAFTQMSLDEAEELELNPEEQETKKQPKKPKKFQKITMKTIKENEEEVEPEENTYHDHIKANVSPVESDKDLILKSEGSCNKEPQIEQQCSVTVEQKKPQYWKSTNNLDVESHIYKCFKEWLSLETYSFIYGEDKVKEKLDSQKLSDYFESLKIAELQVEQQKRYMDICRKLHLKELADEKFDNAVIGNHKLNPIPDYQQLKKDNRELDLKIKSFYSGELHVQEDKNFPTKKREEEEEETKNDDGPPAILPLVDVNAQNALRRKIFLTSLNKTVQLLFQSLKLNPNLVLSDLQALVKTFKLKPDNIVFKPPLWNYIAIILLKILSIKDESLKKCLDTENSKEHFNVWLSSLPHKDRLVNDVLKLLEDIDTFVEDYIICK
ncbi:hypothetical protein Zmor_007198 [Zophobas morio]|uniref:RNA polymerase II subunit B1 CTD phosphatase RPAP2 homolog n=1 Tax=Zophobas morio TaxID=2755281 RepID=A0AA38MPD5_9CUCU|nr:hypothetical protein Zmor_007180 [Zophobas morio]KAJ3662880.1 hypothetical protein Zmor_007198 [Zophobas morio]